MSAVEGLATICVEVDDRDRGAFLGIAQGAGSKIHTQFWDKSASAWVVDITVEGVPSLLRHCRLKAELCGEYVRMMRAD